MAVQISKEVDQLFNNGVRWGTSIWGKMNFYFSCRSKIKNIYKCKDV